jgi:ferric-dicitrate binding protein FerR (iron transport regulator)
MKKRIYSILMAVFVILSFSIVPAADVITLKSGTVIEGEIVEETDELFAIETERGTGFYSKEDIRSINKTRLDVASGRIKEVTGTVEVLSSGTTEWKPADKGTAINEGDSLRSGPDSKAVAVFADKLIMAMEQNSEVDMEKLQQSRKRGINIKVNLDNGQIWNDVGKLRTKRAKFYVETPQAVTGVRGTVFTVLVAPDATTKVAVVKGNVDVRTRGMTTTPIRLSQNSMTEVAQDTPPAKPTDISEDLLSQWKQYESKFRMLRLRMIGGFLQDYSTRTKFIALAAAVIVIVFILERLMRRRRA